MSWPWVWGHPLPSPRTLGMGQGVPSLLQGEGAFPCAKGQPQRGKFSSYCSPSSPPWKYWMSLPRWQVHVVPSQAPHSPQGCSSSCPSPRGFVTTPGLQEEGSLPQPTPALGSQRSLNPPQNCKPHCSDSGTEPAPPTAPNSQRQSKGKSARPKNIRNSSAWGQRGGTGSWDSREGGSGRGWDH